MKISTEKINQIINKADIVSIIAASIKVQKKGRNYWAVCPFHEDNNPSMSISPEKKIYKCFSCGVSGNAIDFVKNYQHLDFLSALKIVADQANVEISELMNNQIQAKYSPEMETIFKINEEALNFYMVLLAAQEGQKTQEYLLNRNISKTEMSKWEIGYASPKIKLHETLIAKGYTLDQLNAAGLISIKDGKVYDYFFDRVIFPIKNIDEKIIGFSARTMTDSQPKYINTRETLVFKKAQLAFNLTSALKAAHLKKNLIVLEGFMDVISLNRIGVENVIAIMGTNFSDYHLQIFKKNNLEIKIFLDGDQAGVNATLKATKRLLVQKIKTSIVDNLTNQDPDELINQGKQEQVQLMIKNSLYPTIYVAEKLGQFLNLNEPADLKAYLEQVFELLILIDDIVVQEKTLQLLEKITKLKAETLNRSWTNYQQPQIKVEPLPNSYLLTPMVEEIEPIRISEPINKINKKNVPLKNYEFSQREILHSLITSQINLSQIEKNLEYIPNADLFVVLQVLIERYKKGTYHKNNWTELMQILELSSFDYENPKWKITPQDLRNSEIQNLNLDDAFLVLQEYKLKKQENYYDEKIRVSQNSEQQKSWLKAKEKTHWDIINLRKKRGKK